MSANTPPVVVDDGEGQEVTLFSVRAKMYLMEKGVGWKERGAGMLKVNVPKSTVDLDDQGAVDPSSFDASVLEDGEDEDRRTHVRLIMRQDHTLRVILNTVILPAMKFQVTNRLKTSTVLFTAFEGGEVRQVQMKVGTTKCLVMGWVCANGVIVERGQRHGVLAACRDAQEAAGRRVDPPSTATRTTSRRDNNQTNNQLTISPLYPRGHPHSISPLCSVRLPA